MEVVNLRKEQDPRRVIETLESALACAREGGLDTVFVIGFEDDNIHNFFSGAPDFVHQLGILELAKQYIFLRIRGDI